MKPSERLKNLIEEINASSYSDSVKALAVETLEQVMEKCDPLNAGLFLHLKQQLPLVLEKMSHHSERKIVLLSHVDGLQRHRYAPELNCLQLKDGRLLKAPQCTSIDEAVDYCISNDLDVIQ